MVLAGLVLTRFASWIYALFSTDDRALGRCLGAIGFRGDGQLLGFRRWSISTLGRLQSSQESASGVLTEEGNINWAGFIPQRVQLEGKRGRPVFMITPQIGVRTARRTRKSSSRLNRFRRPSKTSISCL